ncbi:hypothetical protein chiPu_0016425, partial [Chiloscyllium punctatum]|nr:hypothetical protein [Chiloscyllium punctatum]
MCEVTAANFQSLYPQILEEIASCDFVAIDTELTGLHSFGSPTAQLSLFDNPQERYDKLRPSVTRFTVSQIGVENLCPIPGIIPITTCSCSSILKDLLKVMITDVSEWVVHAKEGDSLTLPSVPGLQIFEVQLVLRRALANIWTEVNDQNE